MDIWNDACMLIIFTIITQFKTYSTARGRHCFVLVHLWWVKSFIRLFLEMEFSILWTQKAVSTKLKNPVPSPKVSQEIYKLFQLFSSLFPATLPTVCPVFTILSFCSLPSVFFLFNHVQNYILLCYLILVDSIHYSNLFRYFGSLSGIGLLVQLKWGSWIKMKTEYFVDYGYRLYK